MQRPGIRLLVVIAALAACSRGPTEPAAPVLAPDGGTVAADPGTAADAGTAITPASPCPTDPAAAGTLLEPCAKAMGTVSADGNRAFAYESERGGLLLVTRNENTKALAGFVAGYFSPDGRSIVLSDGQYGLTLAQADGTPVRLLTAHTASDVFLNERDTPLASFTFAGRWLYYTDLGGNALSLYRVEFPDGSPQLLARFPGVQDQWGPLGVVPSPDGESVGYCLFGGMMPSDCYLHLAGATTVFHYSNPSPYWRFLFWAPDGSWAALTQPCEIVDLAGNVRPLCTDPNMAVGLPALSPDGRTFAAFGGGDLHLIDTAARTDVAVQGPAPVVNDSCGMGFRTVDLLSFTPDGSRLFAWVGKSSFSISAAGGDWTPISSNHGCFLMNNPVMVDISADSRVIADRSPAGFVASIEGAAPRGIQSPDGASIGGVAFEPAGGLNKAIFFGKGKWLANADGSGDWLALSGDYCWWAGRYAICETLAASSSSATFVATTDDGQHVLTVAHDVVRSAVAAQSLFYIPKSGGLYVVDLPRPGRSQ